MVNIYRSDVVLGNVTCIDSDPRVLHLKDHVYCPHGTPGCVPALYDHGRKLVHQSFYSRGPIPSEVVPTCSMSLPYNDVTEYADDETYIFLGEIHDHFGHFLLSTLSRLWQIRSMPSNVKIIMNAGAAERVRRKHVKSLLEAFGVGIDRLWAPDRPMRLRNVILPCACLEERNFVHKCFGKLYNRAGDYITRTTNFDLPGNGPIYLSKSKMVAGVRKIMNEETIENRLVSAGYAVVYPETLPLEQQVAVWRLGRPVVAFNGSSLHTSALSSHAHMISFGWDRVLDSSFALCDWANESRSDYFYFEDGTLHDLGPSPGHNPGINGISSRIQIEDPIGAAEAILRAVDMSLAPRSGNLARGCPTSQSSTYHEGGYDASQLSATSGKPCGRYSFCTQNEENPWWQVDLGKERDITEIVLFNRTDSAADRVSNISILLSRDGAAFDLIFVRDDHAPFGGLNGKPLRVVLKNPRRGRWLRLTIPGPDFLHLDQVEIFGEA